MPELQVYGPTPEINVFVLLFRTFILLAPLSAVAGILHSRRRYFWIAALFSIPLTLYAGLGGNGLGPKLFLLTPILLIIAGYTRSRPISTALSAAAFSPWIWLMTAIALQN